MSNKNDATANGWKLDQQADMDEYYGMLYGTIYTLRPAVCVELGVRGGNSTRCILDALWRSYHDEGEEPASTLTSFDPKLDPPEFQWPDGWEEQQKLHRLCEITGEEGFKQWDKHIDVDFLFVDTDPHSFDQTKKWLDTWVKGQLAPLGLAMFHDTNHKHGVFQALTQFVAVHWGEYEVQLLPGKFGMGMLRRTENEAETANKDNT